MTSHLHPYAQQFTRQDYERALAERDDTIAALKEELDLLRARSPRAYIMTRKHEWLRMLREAIGYMHTCRRQHHGTDWSGRAHLIDALEAAMKELGEAENERAARVLAELDADARNLQRATGAESDDA